jgi:hypothetical protein
MVGIMTQPKNDKKKRKEDMERYRRCKGNKTETE